MVNSQELYEMHSFSTSSNSRQCNTVLNANVPNCYLTLLLLVSDCSHCILNLT